MIWISQIVSVRLYIYLLEDSLTEYSYNAEVAGLSYHFINDPDGIEVSIYNVTNVYRWLKGKHRFHSLMWEVTATSCRYSWKK